MPACERANRPLSHEADTPLHGPSGGIVICVALCLERRRTGQTRGAIAGRPGKTLPRLYSRIKGQTPAVVSDGTTAPFRGAEPIRVWPIGAEASNVTCKRGRGVADGRRMVGLRRQGRAGKAGKRVELGRDDDGFLG